MPEYATATIAAFNDQIAGLMRQAGAEVLVRGLTAGDEEKAVQNHALSVMGQLAATAQLAIVERLIGVDQTKPLPIAANMIAADVDLRFRRAIALAVANPPPANGENGG